MSLLGLAIIGRRNEPLYLCECVRVLREAKQQQPGRRTPPPQRALSDASSSAVGVAGDAPTTTSDLDGASRNDDAESSRAADNLQEDKAGITAQQQQRGDEPPVLHDDDDHNTEVDNSDDIDPFGFKEARHNCELGQSLSFEQSLHLHSALDYVEERIETSAAGLPVVTSGRTGHWLGLLARHDDDDDDAEEGPHVVYGYITATNVKLLVMVCPPVPKESNVRLFLNGIHDTFITHSMNPFSSVKPGQRIMSKRFDSSIREAVRDYEDNRIQQ
jgi:Sedlin, N-terminal conserved region